MPDPDAPALMLFTGGTTGVPKGVSHTHEPMAFTMAQHCAMWPLEFDRERFLTVAPMFHIWGLGAAAWIPVYMRGTLVIVPQYHPETVLHAFEDHDITVFAGGPAPIYAGLLNTSLIKDIHFTSLKYSYSGGAPCSETLHIDWEETTGCGIYEGYGMTECAPIALNPAWGERRLGSVGLPVPETEIRIVDVETGDKVLEVGEQGEVTVRGPQCTSGYRNNPEETAILLRNGWLHTGDIGYIAADGYLSIVDRKKEMVIVGGYNVYPREVDDVLASHPDITEAASIGKHDDFLGEVVVAWVAPRPGVEVRDEDLFAWCKERLVKYKRPVEYFFIDALPRTAARKIDKLALKELL
jgi:long-chain acyl-CoA synthetase